MSVDLSVHRFLPVMEGHVRKYRVLAGWKCMYCGQTWETLPDDRFGCPGRRVA